MYRASKDFVLRSAALSISELDSWIRSDDARHWIIKRFDDPFLREALTVASPLLLQRWSKTISDNQIVNKDWIDTLANYFVRACSRATPFGLFAGVCTGHMSDQTQIVVEKTDTWRRRIRCAPAVLFDKARTIVEENRNVEWMRYVANSTLECAGDRARFWTQTGVSDHFAFRRVELRMTPALRFIIAECRKANTLDGLSRRFREVFPAAEHAAVQKFALSLLRCGLLVCAIEPPLTASSALENFLDVVGPNVAIELSKWRDTIAANDGKQMLSRHTLASPAIAEDDPLPPASSVQVELETVVRQAALAVDDLAEIEAAVDLWHLFCDDVSRHDVMRTFARRFHARWGDEFIPLTRALDTDFGAALFGQDVAEPSYLRKLAIGDASSVDSLALGRAEEWLLNRVAAATARASDEVVLEKADIAALRALHDNRPSGPLSIGAMVSVYADPESDKSVLWIENISNSATGLLGRFCWLSTDLHDAVKRIVAEEEQIEPDAVFAEIVHLPDPQLAAIVSRPVLRAYEIPYAGVSGAPDERQLRIDDLYIGLDRQKRFVLWSRRLNCRVIPVLSVSHNFKMRNSLPVYQFLCSISRDAERSFRPLLSGVRFMPFLPRIRFGRCVLRAATWHVERAEFDALRSMFTATGSIDTWITQRRLPRLTTYGQFDKLRVLDIRNPVLIDIFFRARHSFPLALREMSPYGFPSAVVDSAGQPRRHEIVVPLIRKAGKNSRFSPQPFLEESVAAHLPGSRWLCLKIYTDAPTVDRLVTELLSDWVEWHHTLCPTEPWFFVRYADPDFHLRLRFAGEPRQLLNNLLPRLHVAMSGWAADGRIGRVQLDTYVPEYERYGGTFGVDMIEKIFHVDSLFQLHALRHIKSGDYETRMVLGVHSVLHLLDDFEIDSTKADHLLAECRDNLAKEFGNSPQLRKQFGALYRRFRSDLEASDRALLTELATRSRELTPWIAKLHALAQERAEVKVRFDSIVAGAVHMSMNRLFISHARQQEMVVYELARRCLTARVKRVPRVD